MSPEEYAISRERILYLSEHPLVEGDWDALEKRTRQLTLEEVAR